MGPDAAIGVIELQRDDDPGSKSRPGTGYDHEEALYHADRRKDGGG